MTGSYAGVIGMNKTDVIARFTSVTARRAEHSSGQVRICAAVIDIDETTGQRPQDRAIKSQPTINRSYKTYIISDAPQAPSRTQSLVSS